MLNNNISIIEPPKKSTEDESIAVTTNKVMENAEIAMPFVDPNVKDGFNEKNLNVDLSRFNIVEAERVRCLIYELYKSGTPMSTLRSNRVNTSAN